MALQSEAGIFIQKLLAIPTETDSVILFEEGKLYFESDAAIKIAGQLDFPANLLKVLYWVPRCVRNRSYRFIAAKRKKWFGDREVCRIPAKEEFLRFPTAEDLKLEIARLELFIQR